jgi:two-component system OmpR family response regulator
MQRKVLIIDDEIDLCLLVKSHLRKLDYAVSVAHTLSDGILQLRLEKQDVLLLDNNLPDGTGWSKAEEINNDFPGMKIILISAVSSGHEFYQTVRFPFRIMEKPIQLVDLEKYL